jgi:hypothetical protein
MTGWWESWFAWHPVLVQRGGLRWLRTVERTQDREQRWLYRDPS